MKRLAAAAALFPLLAGAAGAQGFEGAQIDLAYWMTEGDYWEEDIVYGTAHMAYAFGGGFVIQADLGFAQNDYSYDDGVDAFDAQADSNLFRFVGAYDVTPTTRLGISYGQYAFEDFEKEYYGLHALYYSDPLTVEGSIVQTQSEDYFEGITATATADYEIPDRYEFWGGFSWFIPDDDDTFAEHTDVNLGGSYNFYQQFYGWVEADFQNYSELPDASNQSYYIGVGYEAEDRYDIFAGFGNVMYDDGYEYDQIVLGVTFTFQDNNRLFGIPPL